MVAQIVIIVICLILSAYFSATETAFTTLNRIRVKTLAEKGNKRAALTLKLADNYDKLLTTILIGNNIVNILASSLATLVAIDLLTGIPQIESMASAISTAVLTVVVLIVGEISPKTVAKNMPERFAMFSAPIIRILCAVFTPFTVLFKVWQNILTRMFRRKEDDAGMTEEELVSIIEEAEESGDINKEESTLIKSAIEFNDLEVGDIYTPRVDVTAVAADATKEEVAALFNESGYSRLPVYEEDLDNVTGILYYKDFYHSVYSTEMAVRDIIKPVLYVAKSQKISDLLKELQSKQLHFAVVLDEFGSTAGVVTLEDILEEIVGEIWDEHDEIVEEIKEINEKEYVVSGKANLAKLFSILEIDEENESLTVNGWAVSALGRLPRSGDEFESNGLFATVLEMDKRTIKTLKIIDVRLTPEEEEEREREEREREKEREREEREREKEREREEREREKEERAREKEEREDASEEEPAEENTEEGNA